MITLTKGFAAILFFSVSAVFPTIFVDSSAFAKDIIAGQFSAGSLKGWEPKVFKGKTNYKIIADSEKGKVLQAVANGSASGMFREIKIDLTKTPFLNWSWKNTGVFTAIDESKKSGDDYPARIYVVVKRPPANLRSIALNYVWASQHKTGNKWPSPYTSQVQLIAVDSGSAKLGKWVTHKRNLREDLKAVFGDDIKTIHAVAIMSDADNSGGKATAFYGDIWLSSQ